MIKPKLAKGLIVQKMSQETVIFDSERAILFTLNETAGYLFSKLRLGWEKKKIIEAVSRRYQISEKRATIDLLGLLKQLQTKKVLLANPKESQQNLRIKKNCQTDENRTRRKKKKIVKTGYSSS
jgi:hypothetical protein